MPRKKPSLDELLTRAVEDHGAPLLKLALQAAQGQTAIAAKLVLSQSAGLEFSHQPLHLFNFLLPRPTNFPFLNQNFQDGLSGRLRLSNRSSGW
jgi:hypothetical protein